MYVFFLFVTVCVCVCVCVCACVRAFSVCVDLLSIDGWMDGWIYRCVYMADNVVQHN